MHPILLDIGSFKLYTYGLFLALGFMAAVWFSKRNARFYNTPDPVISDLFFVILLSAIVGARLLYVLINFETYRHNLLDTVKIWQGGLVFFGGFIAAVVAGLVLLKLKKLPIARTADIIAPGIALGHAIGRLGCLFAGCCYGRTCDLPFAIKFTNPSGLAPLNLYLHPTQIYMVISNFILFLILMWLQKRKQFHGMVFLVYVMLYSAFRSGIEFFRGDFRGAFFFEFLSLSQGIGLVVSFIALVLVIKLYRSANANH
ncbi:MAG: prolipoprotein diacylglyceryl transferase [Proteobacteria bacterium]|nr:prolipoprotein diacylglyceryl transferase [Pseudomonadota bacterium]